MRLVVLLSALAACTAQPAPVTPTAAPVVECPACPTCTTTVCPKIDCPTCPEPPGPKVAENWYCHDLHRSHMPVSGICRPSADACEYNRRDLITRKIGKPGPCVTQAVAFCFVMYDPMLMNRQRMCARTAENCEQRREWAMNNRHTPTTSAGPCSSMPNTERHTFEDEVPYQLPPLQRDDP